jgi:hypothetical protein
VGTVPVDIADTVPVREQDTDSEDTADIVLEAGIGFEDIVPEGPGLAVDTGPAVDTDSGVDTGFAEGTAAEELDSGPVQKELPRQGRPGWLS